MVKQVIVRTINWLYMENQRLMKSKGFFWKQPVWRIKLHQAYEKAIKVSSQAKACYNPEKAISTYTSYYQAIPTFL